MGKEDIKLKSYFENERRYADLWNGAVFGGKEVLKAERQYRFKKADLLHPVVTLVVYWGEEEWTGARSLHDMIDFGIGDKPLEEELRKLVPEYPIHFLNISVFEHLEYFKTELRPLLELFKRRNSKKLFVEYIEANEACWNMDDESWHMLSQLTHSKSLSKLIEEKNQREQLKKINIERKEITMCKAIDDLENDAREEGIIIGKAEGVLELLEEYGQVSNELKSRILSQKDIGILRKWLKLAAKTASIQEFAQSI